MTEDISLTERQRQVKEQFEADRGFWTELLDGLLQLDPEFLDIYRRFSSHPWKQGTLDPVLRELLYVAIDCSTTHLYNVGTRVHISNALERGASIDEVWEVIQLSSSIGLNSVEVGLPVLNDATDGASDADGDVWSDAADLDPKYTEIANDYRNHAWEEGPLEPKQKAFVLLAVSASATHLNRDAIRTHTEVALEYDATRAEIMEVLEVASVVGIHTVTESVPILIEEAEKQDKLPEGMRDG
jgi:alkylhydroperoxidase/carboxymuconolactone decarboxylase family protein YurZ